MMNRGQLPEPPLSAAQRAWQAAAFANAHDRAKYSVLEWYVEAWRAVRDYGRLNEELLASLVSGGEQSTGVRPSDRALLRELAAVREEANALGSDGVGNRATRYLKPSHIEILAALADGCSIAEAAATVGRSPSTARSLLSDAYLRLGVVGLLPAFRTLGWLRPGR
jgi:molybdenum-dependent DNA-binding transcriptional regulator ModE